MARRRKGSRLYFREGRGYYADFRDFADAGGRREAMIPPGSNGATMERDDASTILAARLGELKSLRINGEKQEDRLLREYAKYHLRKKAEKWRPGTVARDDQSLRVVLGHFGEDARLSDFTVQSLTSYVSARRKQPGARKGTKVSAATILHELHALSSLFRRAVSEDIVDVNPASRLTDKPTIERPEATWLEIGEAARLLNAAKELDGIPSAQRVPFLCPMVATFLFTGGRAQEVLGLTVDDVDMDAGTIHFQKNPHRELKRARHDRRVPIWPQLREILKPHLERQGRGLLFPARNGGLITDARRTLGSAVKRAKIEKLVTPHVFRHTFAAARLQTLDNGAPTSPYTVMKELGHSSLKLIERTYGHLQDNRHRSPVLEYREARVLQFRRTAEGA